MLCCVVLCVCCVVLLLLLYFFLGCSSSSMWCFFFFRVFFFVYYYRVLTFSSLQIHTLEFTQLHYSNEQIPRLKMDGKLPNGIDFNAPDAPVQSGSTAPNVTERYQTPGESAKLEAIGMVRDSGHKVCGFKLLFATLLWSGFMGQIGLPIVSGIMINTFRADGNTFGTLQIIAGFLAIVFAVCWVLTRLVVASTCF